MSDIYTLIGHRVREERTLRGLSIEKLAEAAEMAPSFLGSIERGERKPSVLTLDKLSRALKTPPGDLMSIQGKKTTTWERKAIFLIKSQPDNAKESIYRLLDCLVKNFAKAE